MCLRCIDLAWSTPIACGARPALGDNYFAWRRFDLCDAPPVAITAPFERPTQAVQVCASHAVEVAGVADRPADGERGSHMLPPWITHPLSSAAVAMRIHARHMMDEELKAWPSEVRRAALLDAFRRAGCPPAPAGAFRTGMPMVSLAETGAGFRVPPELVAIGRKPLAPRRKLSKRERRRVAVARS